jgi:HEAT repeat protein
VARTKSVAHWIGQLKDKDPSVRELAAQALAVYGPEATTAIPALTEALQDGQDYVRLVAAEALGSIGPQAKAAVPQLAAALKDKDQVVRMSVAQALGRFGPEARAALPDLVRAFKPSDAFSVSVDGKTVSDRVGEALVKIGPSGMEALVELLHDKDPSVRRDAAFVFIHLGPAGRDAIPVLIEALKDSDQWVPSYAAEALGKIGPQDQRILPALLEALKSTHDQTWIKALEALGNFKLTLLHVGVLIGTFESKPAWCPAGVARVLANIGPDAAPALMEALEHKSSNVRETAVIALGLIGPDARSAVPAILTSIKGAYCPLYAYDALQRMGRAALPALIAALQDNDEQIRKVATEALGRFGPMAKPAIPALVEVFAVDALRGIGPDALPALVALLKDPDVHKRQEVIRVLCDMNPEDSKTVTALVPALLAALRDPDAQVRRETASRIGFSLLAPETTVPALLGTLKDDNPDVRRAAAEALVKMGARAGKFVPALVEALRSADEEVRSAAAQVLGQIGPEAEAAVPELLVLLKKGKDRERMEAAQALASIGPPARAALPTLVEMLKQKDTRLLAADALGVFGPEAEAAVPALKEVLHDQDQETSGYAVLALARIGPAGVPALAEALKADNPWVRARAADAMRWIGSAALPALPALIEVLKEKGRPDDKDNKDLRWSVLKAIGHCGPAAKEAVPVLTTLLKDEDHEIRYEAAVVLGKIGPKASAAVPAMAALLIDKDDAYEYVWMTANALQKIGPTAVPALVEVLKSRHKSARCLTAWALGKIGPQAKEAAPALLRLLDSKDDESRAAAEALGDIGPGAKEAIPALMRTLKSRDCSMASAAAQALGGIGPDARDALPLLEEMFLSDDDTVHLASAFALVKIGSQRKKEALTALIEAAKVREEKDSLSARCTAIVALGAIGPEAREAIPVLVNAIGADLGAAEKLDEEDAGELGCNLVGEALVQIGPAAVPALVEALKNEEGYRPLAAAVVLGRLGSDAKEAIPTLVTLLGKGALTTQLSDGTAWGLRKVNVATETLVQIGPASIPLLVKLLKETEPSQRSAAAEALGQFGPAAREAIPALREALKDAHPTVRVAAAAALRKVQRE